MSDKKQYIAVDLGAESGRVMVGSISSGKLTLEEIHRFGNGPIIEDDSLKWDFNRIFEEIKTGIAKAVKQADGCVAGIAVDSWGVDFGLIDKNNKLIENPYHYRDSRTNGMMDRAFELMPKKSIYNAVGIQFLQFNTLYQLLSLNFNRQKILQKTNKLIFIADLVSYYLSGEIFGEYTLASTSQLMDMRTGKWAKEVFEKLSLPIGIMPDIVQAGTVVGKLTKEIAKELNCEQLPVIAVGSHDTASAVAAVPANAETNWAYLSSGTWSLMGVEIPKPIINDETFKYQFTNEGGVENTIRLLKNIMGLWLVQECKRKWQKDGDDLSYSQITELARKARPFACFIAPNDDRFLSPSDMPAMINEYLTKTGQKAVDDRGQMIRIILESLAFNYRWVLEKLEEITGKQIDILHIVGGGIQNELLCQFTADAIGRKVAAGPIEATAMGNVIMQAIACGEIKSLSAGRELIEKSIELKEYLPEDANRWNNEYNKIKHIFES